MMFLINPVAAAVKMTGPTEKLLLLQVVASLRIFSFVSCRYAALIIVSLQPTLLFRNNPEVF